VLLHATASSQAEMKCTWSDARRLFNIAHSSWVLPFMQLLFHCAQITPPDRNARALRRGQKVGGPDEQVNWKPAVMSPAALRSCDQDASAAIDPKCAGNPLLDLTEFS
jgi:hypothetical protein